MLQAIKLFFRNSLLRSFGVALAVSLSMLSVPLVHAADVPSAGESAQILQAFNKQHSDSEHAKSITDKDKQKVMFLMGVLLFTLVLVTGGLGIAMGVYGKPVFVAHMVFAGLSITMAVAHAIVGLVWFYPF
jgi:hypothetical protein